MLFLTQMEKAHRGQCLQFSSVCVFNLINNLGTPTPTMLSSTTDMSGTPTTGIVGIYQIATSVSTDYSVSLKGCRNKGLTHCRVPPIQNF